MPRIISFLLLLNTVLFIFVAGFRTKGLFENSSGARARRPSKNSKKPEDGWERIKVRFLWVRHGFSCANTLDACTNDPATLAGVAGKMLPQLEAALQHPVAFPDASLDRDFGTSGIQPGGTYFPKDDGDCTVQVNYPGDSSKRVGEIAVNGTVIRVHDLYLDPLLTDCSIFQSRMAGRALLKHLQRSGIVVEAVYSSALLRAIETAHLMMFDSFEKTESSIVHRVLSREAFQRGVVAVPFMTEWHPVSGVASDNTPVPGREQQSLLASRYGDQEIADTSTFAAYASEIFNWSKFKALLASFLLPSIIDRRPLNSERVDSFLNALKAAGDDVRSASWGEGKYDYKEGPQFKSEDVASEVGEGTPEITILLAGHSGVMQETCQMPGKPNNNDVLERLFVWERSADGQSFVLREQSGKCTYVLSGPNVQSGFRDIASGEDVKSCSSPFDVTPLLDMRNSANSPTACESLSLQPNAYKVFNM